MCRAASSRCSISRTRAGAAAPMARRARRRSRISPTRTCAQRFGAASAPLPAAFVTSATLSPREHLEMQAALQRHVDSSISKTINCPADMSFEDFKDVYLEAYDLGLKGCTTFRPNAVTGAVLTPQRRRPAGCDRRRRRRARRRRIRSGTPPAAVASRADRPRSGGRRRLHGQAAGARPGAGRLHLQAQVAGQRPRHLRHHQRHRARRPAAPVRDLHQHQEPRALRLDGGADAHDQRRVPARRRRVVRRRGIEGGVRPAGRALDRRPLRAEPARRHRRGHRAAHAPHRLPHCRSRRRARIGRVTSNSGASMDRRAAIGRR